MMRLKIILTVSLLAGAIFAWNLHTMFLQVPDEANQGAIFRIFYFHFPAAITSFTGFYTGMFLGVTYLFTKNLKYDAIAASVNEVSLVFATIALATGSIWGRVIWGIWWTWDARITSYFVCWLMYVGYLMLRRAVDDPTTRARLGAVLSIFAAIDIMIVWKSIEWWRTQHPGPVLEIRGGGGMAPGMEAPLWWNFLAMLLLFVALVLVRIGQESIKREIDSLRRYAHAF